MFCQIWYLQYIDKTPSKYYVRYRLYKHTDICLYLVNVQGGLKTTQYTFYDKRTKYYLYLHLLCQDLLDVKSTILVTIFIDIVKSFPWDPWPTTCQRFFSLVLGFWDILKEIWPPDPSWFCGRNLWQIFAVCEYHSWRTVLKFGMNTPLEHMNIHAKNHFSSFFSLVRIHSFLYIF